MPILAAVVGAAVIGRFAAVDPPSPEDVVTGSDSASPAPRAQPSPSPRPSPTPRPSPLGAWSQLEPEPFEPRYSAATVWTGTHLIVWGGHRAHWPQRSEMAADGAMWDPQNRSWKRIPPAPMPTRQASAVTWTGEQLFVWGGADAVGHRADGATYHPSRGWTMLPPAPLSPRRGAAAITAGDETLVVGGWDNLGVLSDGAAYNAQTQQWRPLAPIPDPYGESLRATMLSRGPVFWAQNPYREPAPSPPLLYEMRRDEWRPLVRDSGAAAAFSSIVALGEEAYGLRGDAPPQLVRLRPGDDDWQVVRGVAHDDPWAQQVVAGGRFVFLVSPGPSLAVARLDTLTGAWEPLPIEASAWQEVTAVWTGEELLVRGTVRRPDQGPDAVEVRAIAWRENR